MKQVIFVGSTSYSGSTFLDLTLAHDEAGFSCGEVYALFLPTKPHHVKPNCAAFPKCGCSAKHCKVWQSIEADGPQNLYQSIFERFPEVNFIVDSSKDTFWIADQNERLDKLNIATKNIAIWKTPFEIAASFYKRKEEKKWERSWVTYYRNYATLLGDNWRSVRYSAFVKDPAILPRLCKTLEIPSFVGKEQYWKKYPYHTLFGNHSARIHLNDDLENYTEVSGEKQDLASESSHRSIYYRDASDSQLESRVHRRVKKSRYVQSICELLEERDIKHESCFTGDTEKQVKRSAASILARRYKRLVLNSTRRLVL